MRKFFIFAWCGLGLRFALGQHTAMKKVRIVMLRFGTARQKMALECPSNPKPLGTIVYRAAI
jgi:hypothetical protein